MLTRPWIRLSSWRSCCSFTELAVGLTCCAAAGIDTATSSTNAQAPSARRIYLPKDAISLLLDIVALPRRLSGPDRFAVGGLPAPGAGAVAALGDALLVDLGDDLAIAGQQRLGRAHFGTERQLTLGETVRAILLVFLFAAISLGAARAECAFVHLAARAEVADLRILRRTEGTGVEAIAAADAQVLGVEHDTVGRRVEAVHRANRRAGRIGAMHAGHRHRAFAGLAVVDGDNAAAIDAPGHLVLVLAGGDAGIALDATVGVAEEFHTCHGRCSLCRRDLAESDFGLLHAGRRIVSIGGDRVRAFAENDRIGALRVVAPKIPAREPAAEVEGHPSDALADTLGNERLHLGLGIALGARDPDPAAVLDAAIGGIGRADLDEHVLLQFCEPGIGTGLFATALIFDETARREDEGELLGNPLVHGGLLHGEADVGQAELLGVGQRRIFRDQIDPRRVDRLAVNRNRIGQAERIHARLAVAVG